MMRAVIERVLSLRLIIGLLIAGCAMLSIFAAGRAPLDAIPDISDPQIVVYAKWARSPELLEAEVTEPLIRGLVGARDIRSIRGASHMGYAFVYVILEDESKRAAVQQLVTDRLNLLRPELPTDASVTLGANGSSMGWIYQYALVDRERNLDLRDLRLLNQNQVKPALQTVAGVAEVASVGGLEKQYQLRLFPPLLADAELTIRQIVTVLQGSFQETGGRAIEVTNRDYQIRGVVKNENIDQLEAMVVGQDPEGKPVRLKDIGYIQIGSDQRRGISDLDGKGEVVVGIIVMEQKQNALEVARGIKSKLAEIRTSLPAGVEVVATYDRSTLIWDTLQHFFLTLLYELGVVILITVLFLRNVRTAVAPVAILLLGILFTALPLAFFHQTINLFSLAGIFIAIGEMVDATIVIVENCTAELAARGRVSAAEKREIIVRSIANVARPLLFSLLIILASFLPVFFLGEKEGRLFNPLAYTKTFAMAFSTLLTVTLLPIIVVWAFKGDLVKGQSRKELRLVAWYSRAIEAVIRYRYAFVAMNVVLLVTAAVMLTGFQRDFMPEMEEGSILYMPSTLPGLPAREAGWVLQQIDTKLKGFPEVASVFGKLGRADTATDSAPVSMIEATILLKPNRQWREGMTKDRLVAEMDQAMHIPGYVNTWVQPISARVMMQDTGLQTPVGIKIKGFDIATIEGIGKQIEARLKAFRGTKSVIAERISSGYFIDVQFDPDRLADAGVPADDAMATVRYAIGGDNVVAIKQPDGTAVPLNVQYSPEYIDTLQKIQTTSVVSRSGHVVSLGELGDIGVKKRPEMLRNDNGSPTGYVYVTVGGVTPTDYVRRAQPFLAKALELPAGYSLEWTGDYKNADSARAQLRAIVPATLAIIFVLLLLAFRSVGDTLLIMLSVPFALVGGVFLQWALGYSMTTTVIIGYIALFAVAIQTGVIMIIFIRQALAQRTEGQTYMEAVLAGSVLRLRPKLMTVAATTLSLLPIMLSDGAGMEIMKPIATPTIGGMLTSTIYVLFLIPCLFAIGEDIRRSPRLHALLPAGLARSAQSET
jgi:Cu(I)/Ag(I) efflux system membrane protein CusA/SilA